MNTMTQYRPEHERIDRRAKVRAENTTRCPNCYSSHVEQGEFIKGGQALFPWYDHSQDHSQTYAVYAYPCQSCGAEIVTGSTEHYLRRHHEAESPTVH